MSHKSGFVNIVGKPNVGKSTLMNALLGQDLSIVNAKAQTTRHRIKGILNDENYQIVFSDTPGIMKPAYKLHERMLGAVEETFTDADVILYVTEINDRNIDEELKMKLTSQLVPVYVIINKIDTADQAKVEEAVVHWKEMLNPKEILPISALHKFAIDVMVSKILAELPEGPAYFDKDDESVSDRNMRFFAAEIIRERILSLYQQEIPYSVEVLITGYKESETIDRIYTTIYCARETQKGILLGHQGKAIKKLGIESRKKLEQVLEKQVHLELTVKVLDDWRNNENMLRKFGYDQ
ncbi:MAG TPA: GTPase Era [Bacteroidia bacterium]|jgi:GTP-binding protein Era|nr:GTPase Era [Bacteroidia bacterium]